MRVIAAVVCVVVCCTACTSRINRAISRADELRGTQEYDKALDVYSDIIARHRDPKVADVMLRVGDLYQFNLQDSAKAIAAYRRLTSAWPRQPAAITAYLRLADLAEASTDFHGAIEALENLLRYFPAYPERFHIRHRIGMLYLWLKNYEQARIELKMLLEDNAVGDEVRVHVLFDIGESYLMEGKPEMAMPYYDRLLGEFPDHDIVKRGMAQKAEAHKELGEFGVAKDILKQLDEGVVTQSLTIQPTKGRPVTIHVEIADTPQLRGRGLMYRKYMPKDTGMWFIFPKRTRQHFWMKNTFIKLDIIFVGDDMRVVDMIWNAQPLSEKPLRPKKRYRFVLEVPAGSAKRYHIAKGTRMALGQ
jgi:uncharacterized protein